MTFSLSLTALLFAGLSVGASLPRVPSAVWQPPVGAAWQIVLQNALKVDPSNPTISPDSGVGIFDIDLFTSANDGQDTSKIATLKTALGKKVICYFSAGSYEPNRPDSSQFNPSDKGAALDGWPGEYWLSLNSANLAADMGCDAIDPDNVDGYGENGGGLGLTTADSISFIQFLAGEAQKYNLAIGLKNAAEIVPDVLDLVQFSVDEQCAADGIKECSTFTAFIDAGKPVFHIEYPNGDNSNSRPVSDTTRWCTAETEDDGTSVDIATFSTVIKNMDLDGWVEYCDQSVYNTARN
ncbi:putative endo alpha polygalactosaminidase precursor protein [Diplogelasinospora grovesii]|uniref:alpha-galactosidase n=1 Tax=Diplogelasinospora grovesii TaxID=303347 RepID=A0AAN6NDJ9_9PEZI|nr:putative endo alpha polygalactosaminidase precursor protein [Diplogelasinospora grovesii]